MPPVCNVRESVGHVTSLFNSVLPAQVRVESDHTIYGDECKFGGGKVRMLCTFG